MTYPLCILAFAIIINILLLVLNITSARSRGVQSWSKNQLRKMVWNFYIRMYIEEYLFVTIACIIKLYVLDFTTVFESVSSVFAIVMAFTAIFFPLLTVRFLRNSYDDDQIQSEEFNEKFGALTLDLKKKEKSALLFNAMFMARRFCYTLILISACEHSRIQTWMIILLNLGMMVFDGIVRPFDYSFDNKFELMNESFVMVSTYFLLGFSNFIPDPDAR